MGPTQSRSRRRPRCNGPERTAGTRRYPPAGTRQANTSAGRVGLIEGGGVRQGLKNLQPNETTHRRAQRLWAAVGGRRGSAVVEVPPASSTPWAEYRYHTCRSQTPCRLSCTAGTVVLVTVSTTLSALTRDMFGCSFDVPRRGTASGTGGGTRGSRGRTRRRPSRLWGRI